ncbi:MAG: hypothetical protein NTX49_06235 [Chlamydiae bacterium]|nr:hypothetical protein [Chlamydiota bacterium]
MTAISACAPNQILATPAATINQRLTLNADNIPDRQVLDLFQRIGFRAPASTSNFTNNDIQRLEQGRFGQISSIVLLTAFTVTCLVLIGLGIASSIALGPVPFPAMLFFGLLALTPIWASVLSSDCSCSHLRNVIATFLNWAKEKTFGKEDLTGQFLLAQNEFADFITTNGPAIKHNLEERIREDREQIASLSRDLPNVPDNFRATCQRDIYYRTEEIQNRILFTERALTQLAKAEAAVRAL